MNLLKKETKESYYKEVKEMQEQQRINYFAKKQALELLPLEKARTNKFSIPDSYSPPKPNIKQTKILLDIDPATVEHCFDWQFFFHSWRMSGKYPALLDDPKKGAEARKLKKDAEEMIARIKSEKLISLNACYGIFPAENSGEDVTIFKSEKRDEVATTLFFLRNQEKKERGVPNLSLADFIGKNDYLGAFAVSTTPLLEFEDKTDFQAILYTILCDRFAEAATEWLHHKVRTEDWGYSPDEKPLTTELLRGNYQGIRPAPGYPACPDHSEKAPLFKLLNVTENIGTMLSESYAMLPAASVCGYYFSHPESRYFNLGKISRAQLKEYSNRKEIDINKLEVLVANNI